MNFRLALLTLSVSIIAATFFACGGDSGTSGKSESDVSLQAETQDDLPNCTKSREGEIAEVLGERKAYICEDGRWEFDHNMLDSVKTENDLKACLKKNEGDSAWVIKDKAIYVCTDRKWEKVEEESSSIPEYDSEDNMPNCTKDRQGKLSMVDSVVHLCNDGKWQEIGDAVETADSLPNCTKKRNGETVYIIDDGTALVCEDGKWTEDETTSEIIEENKKDETKSSSSKSNKDSDDNDDKSSDSSDKDDPSSSSSKGSSSASTDESPTVDKGSIKDSRDGHTYKTVIIGNQVWFAENLNYNDKKSVCPMKDEKYCDKYGRLYKFFAERLTDSTASSLADVCPSGWHIPDSLDWEELFAYVKANNDGEAIGVSLKARSGWYAEGDSVFIEGDGGIGPFGSIDSTRFGATRGTNRFGFSALPAGSCWESGCYVDDDTRFVAQPFLSDRGGTFKLAFDKDDILYDEDGYFGYTSVRCLQNDVVKIDAMPPVVAIDSLLWMAEDLTHNGSNQFTLREYKFACPAGWRIPTEKEFQKAGTTNKISFPYDKALEFFVSDNYAEGVSINCYSYGSGPYCSVSQSLSPNNKTTRAIRCVSDAFTSSTPKFSCSAAEYDKESGSATWTISKDTEGSYKIAKYTWDFGEYTKDAKLSDNKATLKFSDATRITPTATVNGSIEHKGETYQMDLLLSCPTVMAPPETDLVFVAEKRIDLYSGTKYTAYYEGCNNDYVDAHLSCFGSGRKATVTVEGGGKTYTIKGDYAILGSFRCDSDKHFTIEVSEDMPCEVQ